MEAKEVKDWENHLNLYKYYQYAYHHPTQRIRMNEGGDTIVNMNNELDILYSLAKATILNEQIARKRIFREEYNRLDEEITTWKLNTKSLEHPALNLYKIRFSYTETNKVHQYYSLRKVFFFSFEKLSPKEQKVHFFHLLNDTLLLIKSSTIDISDSFSLYKLGIEREILLTNDRLPIGIFNTVVIVSNSSNQFMFTQNIIRNYLSKIPHEYQDDAYAWALSHTYYWKGELKQSLDYILIRNFRNSIYVFLSKVLSTQIYFDLFLEDSSYEDYLLNFISSFEKWLNREGSRSDYNKKPYLRFLQLTRKLALIYRNPNSNTTIFQNKLNNSTNIQCRNWLLKKLNFVEKKQATKK